MATAAADVDAVASAATSTTLAAANGSRTYFSVYNTDANNLYLKFGVTATTNDSFTVVIPANGFYEMPQPIYTGIVAGIWSADGSGSALVTEF